MMDCRQWTSLLDAHVAGSLTDEQERAFTAHLDTCELCRHLYTVRMDCRQLDEGAGVPDQFALGWRRSIRQEEESIMQEPTQQQPGRRPAARTGVLLRALSVAAALLLVVGGTLTLGRRLGTDRPQAGEGAAYAGAARSMGNADDNRMERGLMTMDAEPAPAPKAAAPMEGERPAKIIRTVSLTLSTRSFDEDLARVQTALKEMGGYVENSDINAEARARRYARLRLRVPVGQLDSLVDTLKGVGDLLSLSESAEDVSEQYADVETRLQTQKTKMARLQALLDKSPSVEELLKIETEIANTQYELDSLTGALRGYDSKVDYASVWLTLREETVPETQGKITLGERIRRAMADTWDMLRAFAADLAVFMAVLLPFLAALAVIVIIIVVIVRKHRRNKK